MSSKAISLTLKSRKIGLLTLPNELLFVIVSDVLANFFHNMILHPNVRRIWNGLHTLRRVSRKLKTMAEEIWTKAVGPWNGAHTPPCLDVMAYTRVLLHNQVRTIQIPEIDNVDKPLLIAYLLYGIGLFAEMRREKSRLPPGLDQLDDPESGEFWFYKGLGMATRTSPWDMAQVIRANLMTHLLESKIASLLRSVDYLVDVARDRSSVALDTSGLILLDNCLSNLEVLMKDIPEVVKQTAPSSLLALRGIVKRIEPFQGRQEDAEAKSLRERITRSMETIWDLWNKTHISVTSHSRLMRKKAVLSRLVV